MPMLDAIEMLPNLFQKRIPASGMGNGVSVALARADRGSDLAAHVKKTKKARLANHRSQDAFLDREWI